MEFKEYNIKQWTKLYSDLLEVHRASRLSEAALIKEIQGLETQNHSMRWRLEELRQMDTRSDVATEGGNVGE